MSPQLIKPGYTAAHTMSWLVAQQSLNHVIFLAGADQESIMLGCETIDSLFLNLTGEISDVLKKEINYKTIHDKCLQNVGNVSLSENALSRVKNARNFDELFNVLFCCKLYWNWMDTRMLEKITVDCSAASQLINQYKTEVFSKNVKGIISEIPNLEIPKDKYTEVKAIWNNNFINLTIGDIVEQWNKVEKIFDIKETMLLKSITFDCVEVCWLLPNHLVECVICSTTNNQPATCGGTGTEELLSEVLYLKIGDVVIKDDITSKLIVYFSSVMLSLHTV